VTIRKVKNNNRHNFDIYAFDQLSEQACYWLGFLYADGYIGNNRSIVLNLQRRDHSHLEKFKSFMKSDAPVHLATSSIGDKRYPRSQFIITNPYFGQRFGKLGLNPKNSEKAFDAIPHKQHWIRGLFDGDGSASSIPNNGIRFMGEHVLMALVHNHLLAVGADNNPNRKIERHTISDIYYLSYSGRNVAIKVLDYLYQDATVWLERKRQTVASWPKPQRLARNEKGQYYNPSHPQD
jgi:hypothetical protein